MRITVRSAAGSVVLAFIALLSAVVLALTSSIQAAVSLLAGTALIVPGTGTPNPADSTNYEANALNYYVAPAVSSCTGDPSPCGTVGVPYTAQFWPFPFAGWGGLSGAKWNDSVQNGLVSLATTYGGQNPSAEDPVVVFGYSQGATVASLFKKQLATLNGGLLPDDVSFVLIGNPNRPNGGLFERLALLGTVPILDATFGQPTPTDTAPAGETNTTDIAFQYDGVADFPSAPINLLADVNALAGFWYVHGTYLDPRGRPPATTPDGALAYGYTADEIEAIVAGCQSATPGPNCQQHGDTIYVTLPARSLPIMQPFIDLGTSTGTSALVNPIVALIQPATQTLIETGYDRRDYGNPTPFQLIPRVNPIQVAGDLIADIPEGVNAAVATIQSPTHTIPDLPPVWGSDDSALTAKVSTASTESTDPPALPTLPKLPKLNVVKLNPLSQGNISALPAGTDQDRPKIRGPIGSDFHPIRDLAKSIKKALDKPNGIEKALARLADQKKDKDAAHAATGTDG